MIRLVSLSKSFGDKIVLSGVDFHFGVGERYGLVGANGAGKTTLLGIISGYEVADSGEVIAPRDCAISHLPQVPNPKPLPSVTLECMSGDVIRYAALQRVNELAMRMAADYSESLQHEFEAAETACRHAGGYALESRSRGYLTSLGFKSADLDRPPLEFSGGWRMRIELAKVLLREPDVLVLDEPTNHLDLPTIAWLEARLKSYAGTLIYVSHDRSLLNRLSTRTLHLKNGKLKEYLGGFDSFLEQMEEHQAMESKERERLASHAKRLEDFAERFGAKATLASRAKSKLKMAAKLRALEEQFAPDEQERDVRIKIPESVPSGRVVLRFDGLLVGYQSPLFEPMECVIERGWRVAVIGPNGAGKSSLIKTLIGEIAPLGGEFRFGENVAISYFAQEQSEVLDHGLTILETVMRSSAEMDDKSARRLLGALKFSGTEVNKLVKVLSGGETNRVGLARMLTGRANFLVLDEPTNHLDMSSVEMLAAAMTEFSGTLLFVSHNREFVDEVCTHVLAVTTSGQVGLFHGNLEDYARSCANSGFPNVLATEAASSPAPSELNQDARRGGGSATPAGFAASQSQAKQSWAEQKGSRAERNRIRREILRIEKRMQEVEGSRMDLTAQMDSIDATNYLEIQRIASTIAALGRELENAEQEWFGLNERLEGIASDD